MTAPVRSPIRPTPDTPDELTIEVTADDIAAGMPVHPHLCPIAHALRRAGYENPVVHYDRVSVGADLPRDYWPTSPALSQFIADFDIRDGRVAPCTLTLTRHRRRRP